MWKFYAILSALFAVLTAILAKVGVKGINGNVATAVRTLVVLVMAWGIVFIGGQMKEVRELSKTNILFLVLSGIATGLSWIFYFKALETGDVSKVAPIDKLSVVFAMAIAFVVLKRARRSENHYRRVTDHCRNHCDYLVSYFTFISDSDKTFGNTLLTVIRSRILNTTSYSE